MLRFLYPLEFTIIDVHGWCGRMFVLPNMVWIWSIECSSIINEAHWLKVRVIMKVS